MSGADLPQLASDMRNLSPGPPLDAQLDFLADQADAIYNQQMEPLVNSQTEISNQLQQLGVAIASTMVRRTSTPWQFYNIWPFLHAVKRRCNFETSKPTEFYQLYKTVQIYGNSN